MHDLQISVNQLSSMRWSMAEDALFCSENGIRSLGLSSHKVEEFGLEKTVELLDDLELSASSYGVCGFTPGLSDYSLEDQIDQGIRFLNDAAVLAADSLLVQTGGSGLHLKKNRFNVIRQALDRLLPVAEDLGIKLAIEYVHPDHQTGPNYSHSISDIAKLVKSYQHRFLGCNLDFYHVGNELFDQMIFDREKVFGVQLSDFTYRNGRRVRAALGAGDLQLDRALEFLHSIQYQRPIELELWGEEFDYQTYESTLEAAVVQLSRKTDPTRLESIRA